MRSVRNSNNTKKYQILEKDRNAKKKTANQNIIKIMIEFQKVPEA